MNTTRHLCISGRVQGVGYRDALRRQALACGLAGWVRNRLDGTVEALLQGEDRRVEEVIANVLKLAREYGALPDVVEKTYRAMIAAFIAAEHREHQEIWKGH